MIRQKIFMAYQNYMLKKMYSKLLPQRVGLIVDVGSFVGDYTSVFTNFADKVISIEPNEETFAKLKERFKGNDKVVPLNFAIGDREHNTTLYTYIDKPQLSSLDESWAYSLGETLIFKPSKVHMIPLTKIFNTYGTPDYIKIDVEGFEYEVVSRIDRKVPLISIEYHKDKIMNLLMCFRHLERLGKFDVAFTRLSSKKLHGWYSSDVALSLVASSDAKQGDIFIKYRDIKMVVKG